MIENHTRTSCVCLLLALFSHEALAEKLSVADAGSSLASQSSVPVVDQNVPGTLPGSQSFDPTAQTFTVGIGGILHSVDLLLRTTGEVTFDLLPTDSNGYPAANFSSTLFQATIPDTSDQPGLFSIDVQSAGIMVQPGDQLAIALSPQGGVVRWAWLGTMPPDHYPGGARYLYTGNLPNPWFQSTIGETGFLTRVLAVPEPSSILLGLFSLAGFVMYGKKR